MPLAGQEVGDQTIERWCTVLQLPTKKLQKDWAFFVDASEKLVEVSTTSTTLGVNESFVLDLETVGAVVRVHARAAEPADALRVSVDFVEIGSRAYDAIVDDELRCCQSDAQIALTASCGSR